MTRSLTLTLTFAVAVAAAGSPVLAQGFDGQYQVGACTRDVSDGRMSIEGGSIRFWESACTLTNPVGVRDMGDATLFDAQCSGEGETWSYRLLIMSGGSVAVPEADLILLNETGAIAYQRCD
ncbi:hypothetical protein HKCCSP123_10405 [Rhodobacterales bacterium HKCCSP123]|nr:hypothetical protein [Rhodobacterales bacterium HKCCSP123]